MSAEPREGGLAERKKGTINWRKRGWDERKEAKVEGREVQREGFAGFEVREVCRAFVFHSRLVLLFALVTAEGKRLAHWVMEMRAEVTHQKHIMNPSCVSSNVLPLLWTVFGGVCVVFYEVLMTGVFDFQRGFGIKLVRCSLVIYLWFFSVMEWVIMKMELITSMLFENNADENWKSLNLGLSF